MRVDPDAIEASRPGDREIALLAAEVRWLRAVIAAGEPALTDAEPVAWGVMIEGTTVFSVWLDEEEAKRERRRLKKLYEGTRHGRIVVVPLYDRHPKKRKK